ncbi:TlpA family protein disulfide reductase [Winogradskyella flava]|uniref:TlpA family protein disulfide reductase n=1 Tax=Winogradskyella flava TaxID=1884876 RepID=UPI002492BF5D|nr:TlpA disulfide reductase family protein [Winogradskyella flava]
MKQIVLLCLFVVFSCKEESKNAAEVKANTAVPEKKETAIDVSQIDLEIYDYDGLEPLINKKDDKIHVVNFWATWCAPCVKELPYFEKLNQEYKDENVEVLLVSLDFPRNYDTKLKPFMKKHNLQSKVIAFDDVDQNRWIPAINEKWSGALPATIIYNNNKRQFYERSFTQEELEIELKQFLN